MNLGRANVGAADKEMRMERTLLLVDDEESIGAALARLLKPYGYRILRAKSGREGLALLAQNEAGVVVSDQCMPEMTGVEFLTQVKELYPYTVRIVLSGYADLDSVTDAINRGAIYKFLTKPWDNETLCANILEAFRHHELMLEKEQLMREIQSANDLLAQVNLEWADAMLQRDGQIKYISNYSTLTGLPNRRMFLERLVQELAHAQRDDRLVAIMFINLDRFQQINSSFGHHAGDLLLQAVAGRLRKHARAGDTVAHVGGDEFGFVLTDMKSAQGAADVAQGLIDTLAREPVSVDGKEFFVTACIGISLYPFDGIEANTLVKNASVALHHAKAVGGSRFRYYAAQMNATAWQRLAMETELHHALEREEFVLHYQPKVDLASGKIIGMEALLRWQSPECGLVAPGEFIPLLEETGLILPVGAWVLDTACRQAQAWQQTGLSAARIAVNLSVLQFRQPGCAATVRNILEKSGMIRNAGTLELELTESLLVKDMDGTVALLDELHEMGVRLSIDDFGTGYSCLSYLKHLPIDKLKIDQSFIRNLPADGEDAAIVNAIIALGHGLGMSVIAEGVETVEQLACLQTMKCDEAQGYLFSRPVPAAEMTRLLQNGAGLDMVMGA